MKKRIEKTYKKVKDSKERFEKQIRLVITIYRNYNDSQTQLWTASLTYYSILAVIPVIALTLGITKGFGIDIFFEEKMYSLFPESKEGAAMIINAAKNLIDSTKGSVLTGVGVVILLWTIVKLLLMLENAFNKVWKVKRNRSIVRRIIDYVAIVFLGPIFFAVVLTTISFLTDHLKELARGVLFKVGIGFFINLTGFVIIVLLFTYIYIIVPNTKVRFKPALVAGISTTIMFFVLKFVFFHVQSSITQYNAIYGSLSFVPIFLIWVQYIWVSVLLGVQISFSSQNLEKYSIYKNGDKMPLKLKKELSILVVYCISKRFHEGEAPYSTRELAQDLGVEMPVIRDILSGLEDIELINEIVNDSDDDEYQISLDPSTLTIEMLLNKMEGINAELYKGIKISEKYKPVLENIQKDIIYENKKLIKDIDQ